jgi:hypothetical protein
MHLENHSLQDKGFALFLRRSQEFIPVTDVKAQFISNLIQIKYSQMLVDIALPQIGQKQIV